MGRIAIGYYLNLEHYKRKKKIICNAIGFCNKLSAGTCKAKNISRLFKQLNACNNIINYYTNILNITT